MADKMIRCPQCRAEAQWVENPYRPFCSERCQMIDLGNWADESYSVPASPDNVIPFPQVKPDEEL